MITEGFTSTEFSYKKSTSLSNIDETIIWEAELNILILGNNLFGIYNKSKLSSKKRKRDVNICGYDFFVFIAWKKNIANFSFRAAIVVNESFLGKSIQFLIKYKKYRYICYIYIKYLAFYFGLRTRELKEGKMKEVLKSIY